MGVVVDWGVGSPRRGEDYCAKAGAEELAQRIIDYWAARGYLVSVSLQECGFHSVIRAVRFDIKSDIVNGWPTGYKKSA